MFIVLLVKKIRLIFIITTMVVVISVSQTRPVLSCELSATAIAALATTSTQSTALIQRYTNQLKDFIYLMSETVEWMIEKRLEEFDSNTRGWLSDWWDKKFMPALKDQTAEMAIAQIDQTMSVGIMIDQTILSEVIQNKKKRQLEAQRRYKPSALFCQVDSLGPSENKAYEISRALNAGFTADDMPRRFNKIGTKAAQGEVKEIDTIWKEYINNFCDNTKGDQGCDSITPGVLSGKHKDIAGMLWGDKQTIDMVDPKNRLLVNAAIRYLIYLGASEPVPPRIVSTVSGKKELLSRRSEMARSNTIYNVIGQIIAERVGGSGSDTKKIREAAGIKPADASDNASYREISEALNRDKFFDKKYTMKLITSPEENTREQISIGAARLQLMEDNYHRMEELLFMMSADYARDLDKRKPRSALSSVKFQ